MSFMREKKIKICGNTFMIKKLLHILQLRKRSVFNSVLKGQILWFIYLFFWLPSLICHMPYMTRQRGFVCTISIPCEYEVEVMADIYHIQIVSVVFNIHPTLSTLIFYSFQILNLEAPVIRVTAICLRIQLQQVNSDIQQSLRKKIANVFLHLSLIAASERKM